MRLGSGAYDRATRRDARTISGSAARAALTPFPFVRYDPDVQPFNPLDYHSCLTAVPPPPSWSGWQEHIPFAMLLVEMLRPRVYVELGVHTGASYMAFCQAVANLGLACSCYGVDTFEGDDHAGRYGREIEIRLRERHDPTFGAFSTLISTTFDEAAGYIADGSVDLLHIDGLHTHEAVSHDFATWSPKLSPRGVVLFHDINVRERGFGVWRFWDEVRARFPHFAFRHGSGLGVLAVGPEYPRPLDQLLSLDPEAGERVGDLFFLLGNRLTLQVQQADMRRQIGELHQRLSTTEAQRDAELASLRQQLAARDARIAELQHHADALAEKVQLINDSLSFRLGLGATAPIRWVAGKLGQGG